MFLAWCATFQIGAMNALRIIGIGGIQDNLRQKRSPITSDYTENKLGSSDNKYRPQYLTWQLQRSFQEQHNPVPCSIDNRRFEGRTSDRTGKRKSNYIWVNVYSTIRPSNK